MSGTHRAAQGGDARRWATLAPEALQDEIRSNRRSERLLMVLVAVVSAAVTGVVLLLHGSGA